MNNFEIREAKREDCAKILGFINALAVYEKMESDVVATEMLLEEWIFERKIAKVIIAVENGMDIGFALYFHNFSTFVGRGGIYLEDLFINPEYRGRGYGKALLQHIAKEAVLNKCGRVEWACLDWNKPSIDFYLSLGAKPLSDWTTYRLSGDELSAFAK